MDDNGDLMEPRDHMMVGITSCMLFISYKMMFIYPFVAGMCMWFNIRMFNHYCMWRKSEK